MVEAKCFVEIFLVKRDFIIFDFGEFAIIIGYDTKLQSHQMKICAGEDYEKKFMSHWVYKINQTRITSVEVDQFQF